MVLCLESADWPAQVHLPALPCRWIHQVCPRLVLWSTKAGFPASQSLQSHRSGDCCQQQCGSQPGEKLVIVHDWQAHLGKNFKALPGMKQFHHFRFHADSPGVCFVKRTADDEEVAFNILTTTTHAVPRDRPVALQPAGLDNKLYRQIRQYCQEDTRDVMCPHPSVPEGSSTASLKRCWSDSVSDTSVESVVENLRGRGRSRGCGSSHTKPKRGRGHPV